MKNIINFIKNIFKFKKELWNFRPYDYSYNLEIFKKSLILTKNHIENFGLEIDETKIPKIKKINEVINCINYDLNLKYFDELDKLGLKCPDMKMIDTNEELSEIKIEEDKDDYFNKAEKLEEENWNKLWSLLKDNLKWWWD